MEERRNNENNKKDTKITDTVYTNHGPSEKEMKMDEDVGGNGKCELGNGIRNNIQDLQGNFIDFQQHAQKEDSIEIEFEKDIEDNNSD